MRTARIVGTGAHVPSDVVSNDDLRTRWGIDTDDAWIRPRTGIAERRFAPEGTGTAGFLRGLSRYLADRGYAVQRFEYAGWRAHPKEYTSGRSRPDLAALAGTLRRPAAAAWWNVGWYQREVDAESGLPRFRRTGGHWVLVAGRESEEDGGTWLVRDPSPRSGRRPRVERVRIEVLETGELVGAYTGLPQVARGVPQVLSGLVLPKSASDILPRRGRTTVDGSLNGCPFQATLEPDGQLSHWLRVDENLRLAAWLRHYGRALGRDRRRGRVGDARRCLPRLP